ncbi:MAG: malto-oligosyltrehalose synthase [Acidobacteriota bacterium]
MMHADVPLATYRVQLTPRFGLRDVARVVPYCQELGISHVYLSPIFKARPGSLHGYDVTDHAVINPELGTEEDLVALVDLLTDRRMGLLLDIVPNHTSVDETNWRWRDVLENGPSSPYARFFDIDWSPSKQELANKILLPILGEQYGRVLERGELRLGYEGGSFWVYYGDMRFPVAPRSWGMVLAPALDRARRAVDPALPAMVELESIITSLQYLPPRTQTEPEKVQERMREKGVAGRRLATLVESSSEVRTALFEELEEMNGRSGDPRSFDRLEAFLADQGYRLCYWRVAADEINYRRFFDINDLAAIRVEDPEVFETVHSILKLPALQACFPGLRIDHPDGLLDPEQYFLDLHRLFRRVSEDADAVPPPKAPPSDAWPCYLLVEKILNPPERLPPRWAVSGTTGYDFLNRLNGLFIDRGAERAVHDLYSRYTNQTMSFADIGYRSKQVVLDSMMSSELYALSRRLDAISEQHRWSRDFTQSSLHAALREVIACFSVYRTYVRPGSKSAEEQERRCVMDAVQAAKARNPATDESIFDFIASVLLLDYPDDLTEAARQDRQAFVLRFQQLTPPVMAKGIEDTAFYRYYPLASLNEVGGSPEPFGVSVAEFHGRMVERMREQPHALSATSTHDAKRSGDVRARVNVLSEMPADWDAALNRWSNHNAKWKSRAGASEVPDRNEEYLLYQTLVGVWPLERPDDGERQVLVQRITGYVEKALREAKVHTSWLNPNRAYEEAVSRFTRQILAPEPENLFLPDMEYFCEKIGYFGMINSISQTLVKIVAPGVPDFYQGEELWDFRLVDPDNRGPVDFLRRESIVRSLQKQEHRGLIPLAKGLLYYWKDGRIKLHVIRRALGLRGIHPELFLHGAYVPLQAAGELKAHVLAFGREHGTDWAVVVVPRFMAKRLERAQAPLGRDVWGETALLLPPEAPLHWKNALTGEAISQASGSTGPVLTLHTVLRRFPVALLHGNSSVGGSRAGEADPDE